LRAAGKNARAQVRQAIALVAGRGDVAVQAQVHAKVSFRIASASRESDFGGDPAAQKDASEAERARVFFRAVPVFDRSQVDPLPDRDPAPLEPPSEPITGDSHGHLIAPLDALAGELGYRVQERDDTGPAGGWCDPENKLIVIDASLAANAKVRVRVHELAHALGIGYREYGRAQAEVLVDTVTYIVCASAGLDVAGRASRTSPAGARRTRWPRSLGSRRS
jgi:hypothetical protein